jgi:hypothetical protein
MSGQAERNCGPIEVADGKKTYNLHNVKVFHGDELKLFIPF